MHHPRHSHIIRSFRAAAFLLLAALVSLSAACLYLIAAALELRQAHLSTGLILMAVSAMAAVAQRACSCGAKCPLCMMPPLGKPGCSKNSRAAKLFGSHRLPVALSIIFTGTFRCPYCNEPTELTLKTGRPGR